MWNSPSRKYSDVLPVKSSPSKTSSNKDGIEVKKDDNEDVNDDIEKESENEEEEEVDEIKPSDKQAPGYNDDGYPKEICTRETGQSTRETELMALVKQLKSELDLFKNAHGQPETPTQEVDTLNDVNVVLRAQDIVAKKNRFQNPTGNIILNNLVLQKQMSGESSPTANMDGMTNSFKG